MGNQIPEDVHGDEFAEWLTKQYQLAMAKGIELARREGTEMELECGESEHARSSLLRLLELPSHGSWEAIYDAVKTLKQFHLPAWLMGNTMRDELSDETCRWNGSVGTDETIGT